MLNKAGLQEPRHSESPTLVCLILKVCVAHRVIYLHIDVGY